MKTKLKRGRTTFVVLLLAVFAAASEEAHPCRADPASNATAAKTVHDVWLLRKDLKWQAVWDEGSKLLSTSPKDNQCRLLVCEAGINLPGKQMKAHELLLKTVPDKDHLNKRKIYWLLVLADMYASHYQSAANWADAFLKTGESKDDHENRTLAQTYWYAGRRNSAAGRIYRIPGQKNIDWFLSNGVKGNYEEGLEGVRQLRASGQVGIAIELLKKCKSKTLGASGFELLAECQSNVGLNCDAANTWSGAMKQFPADRTLVMGVSKFYHQELHDPTKALVFLENYRAGPGDIDYWTMKARLLQACNKPEAARLHLDKLLRLKPSAELYYLRFVSRRNRQVHSGEALSDIEKAIELSPDNVAYRLDKIDLLKSLNQLDRALIEYTLLADIAEKEEKVKVVLNKADLQSEMGDLRAALETVKSAAILTGANDPRIVSRTKAINLELKNSHR